jgi:hypothetical protein
MSGSEIFFGGLVLAGYALFIVGLAGAQIYSRSRP